MALVVTVLAAPTVLRAEIRPDVGIEAGPGSCAELLPSLGIAAHAGFTVPADTLRLGFNVVGDVARYWNNSTADQNGDSIDVYHVSGRIRAGGIDSPLYALVGFGWSYMTNRLEEGEVFEVPSISRWSPIIAVGGGCDFGRWGIELNVRQPTNRRLVDNTGFGLGPQFDVRVGVRL